MALPHTDSACEIHPSMELEDVFLHFLNRFENLPNPRSVAEARITTTEFKGLRLWFSECSPRMYCRIWCESTSQVDLSNEIFASRRERFGALLLILGSLDEAARGLLVRRLQPAMASKVPDQKTWLDPYLRGADRRVQPHYQKMAQNLKRTLVFNNGITPLGLLRDFMEYALNDNTKIDGVFRVVREKFKVAGSRESLAIVTRIYEFRNRRVAHQENEIADPKKAQHHLVGWIKGLKALTEAIA